MKTLDYNSIKENSDTHTLFQTDKNQEIHFSNVDAFMAYLAQPLQDEMRKEAVDRHLKSQSKDWLGGATAKQMASHINQRTLDKTVDDMLETNSRDIEIETAIQTDYENAIYLASDGVMVEMNSYLSGEEDCMLNFDIQPVESRTVWIAQDIVCSGGAETADFYNRGVAIVNAITSLQAQNVNVGVIAYVSGNANIDTLMSVVIKRPDEALNTPMITNTLAHPCFFRALGHAMVAKISKRGSGGLNKGVQLEPKHFINSYADTNNIMIMSADFELSQYNTIDKAHESVKNQCNDFVNKA